MPRFLPTARTAPPCLSAALLPLALAGMALLAGCQPPGESADSPDTAADAAVPPQTVAEWPLFRGDPGLAGFSPGDITPFPPPQQSLTQEIPTWIIRFMDPARLTNKVCLVTGAAQNIGLAIGRRFLDEGLWVDVAAAGWDWWLPDGFLCEWPNAETPDP